MITNCFGARRECRRKSRCSRRKSRIREAIRAGDLDAHRNGASIVILPDDVRVWLKALPAVESTKSRP
jgi:hypothetical protein